MEYDQTEVYGGEDKFSFWYIGNQTLEYGEEFHLTISCPLHFSNFPFDSHECRVEYGDDSYGKDKSPVVPFMKSLRNTVT